jgi:hypothetical protein
MPLFYTIVPGATQTTNATGGTENDCFFVKPGTRTIWVNGVQPAGKANAASTISGITYRLKKWTTTASSAGTSVTPTPNDIGYQAAKQSAAYSASALTSGTGGPTLLLSLGTGTSTPGPWITDNLDRAYALEGSATQSIDVFNSSPAASQVFEMSVHTVE